MTLKTISYGGGVQSTALVILAATGRIPNVDAALFSNVGDDSEHPATITYVRQIAIPWAAERGLPIHELHKVNTRGAHKGPETLWGRLMRDGSRSLPIPIRMSNGAPGTRSCTSDFKIRVVGKWLKEHGATADDPAEVLIGISTDEVHRIGNKKVEPYEIPRYPLVEDFLMDRSACAQLIRETGLPVPPKSACFFCPFHKPSTWAEQRRDEPELFRLSQLLEDKLNERRLALDKDPVWLTRFNKRLSDAVAMAQDELPFDGAFGDGACDEGYCWT